MADVERFVRDIREVVYTVGPDTVHKAVLQWLIDKHDASFNDETTLQYCSNEAIAVTTRFASADAPKESQ